MSTVFCYMHLFWPARCIWMMGAHVCLLIFTECNLWNANTHINTPTSTQEAAMLTRTVWTHTHAHTHISIGGFVNGRPVSFHGNRDRQILYVLGSLFCVRVRVCGYCQFMCIPGWQSPRDRLQAWHLSDIHCSYFHTIQSLTVPFEGIVFWFSLVKDIVLLALAAHPIARLHSRYKVIG